MDELSLPDDDLTRRLRGAARAVAGDSEDHVDDGDLLKWRSGHLPDDERATVSAHLEACAACRALLAELSTGVTDAQVRRALEAVRGAPAVSRPPARRALWVAGGALAAAAAVLFFVLRGPTVPSAAGLPYVVEGPSGGMADVRSGEGPASRVFLPDSQLALVVRPEKAIAGAAPALGVFVAAPEGPLQAVPAGAVVAGEGGAWRFAALGREVFGATPGPRVLVAVVGDAALLDGLNGKPLAAARDAANAGGARFYEWPTEYRTSP